MVGDYEPIEEFLLGQGLTEREARLVTTKEYLARVKAYGKRLNEEWERTRYIAWTITRMSGRVANNPPKKPQGLFALPTDKKVVHEVIEITDNEIQALKNIGMLR